MTRNRTPINRAHRPRFSDAALVAFRRLQACSSGSEEWWRLHNIIFDELHLRPWQFPAVLRPDRALAELLALPELTARDERKAWDDHDAQNLYRALEAAVAEQ